MPKVVDLILAGATWDLLDESGLPFPARGEQRVSQLAGLTFPAGRRLDVVSVPEKLLAVLVTRGPDHLERTQGKGCSPPQ